MTATACVTTTHWATHVSAECAPGGSGQCDGFCFAQEHIECACSCHTDWDLPQTVAEVRDWHDEANDVVASFEKGGEEEHWSEAVNAATRLNDKPVDGSVFVVKIGQGRSIVVHEFA